MVDCPLNVRVFTILILYVFSYPVSGKLPLIFLVLINSLTVPFKVVDMRWGVRDEMTNEHMTTALCMNELRGCQKYSMGPNFIYFGGQKYGFRSQI